MFLETKNIESKIIISIKQRIDIDNSPLIEEKLINTIKSNIDKKIIINFQDVEYINSTGLKIFIAIIELIKNTSTIIKICSINNDIKRLFEVAGITDIFKIYKNEEEAIVSFND